MAASKSIASAQLVEEAAAIVLVHRHQCQSTCWSTLKALGRPNAAVCLLAVPVDALCCWCDCCACAAAKPLPEPRDVLIRHAGRCRMQGGAVGIGRAGRGRRECRHRRKGGRCKFCGVAASVADEGRGRRLARLAWVRERREIARARPSRRRSDENSGQPKGRKSTYLFVSIFPPLFSSSPSLRKRRCCSPPRVEQRAGIANSRAHSREEQATGTLAGPPRPRAEAA